MIAKDMVSSYSRRFYGRDAMGTFNFYSILLYPTVLVMNKKGHGQTKGIHRLVRTFITYDVRAVFALHFSEDTNAVFPGHIKAVNTPPFQGFSSASTHYENTPIRIY